jgi:hypothetical protein
MNHSLLAVTAASVIAIAPFCSPVYAADAGRIEVYVTPYYNSSGPAVDVGAYSRGLASNDRSTFVVTVQQMKRHWSGLTFPQLYVGAIRLYDLGYRDEAIHWFYTAQFRGRQFAMLADRGQLGRMGDRGFELYRAQYAFFDLAGPQINGYAFGHLDALIAIVRRVRDENRKVPNLNVLYPGVRFIDEKDWARKNGAIGDGLDKLATYLNSQRATIARERAGNGTQARFAGLTSEDFPGGC